MRNLNFESKIINLDALPKEEEIKNLIGDKEAQFVLIYDEVFENLDAIQNFKTKLAVDSGEALKSLDAFPEKMKEILSLVEGKKPSHIYILSMGGGSVGDFAGFVASVLKRGVKLIHVPSTWLAAIDSSHGGKTALNVGNLKNQIGSFYPAHAILFIKSLFASLASDESSSAMAELIKIAIITDKELFSTISSYEGETPELLWSSLTSASQAKMSVVAKDPFEESTIRQTLNLGHTTGHVFESFYGISHGLAVAQGMYFAARFSLQKGILEKGPFESILEVLDKYFVDKKDLQGNQLPVFSRKEFEQRLVQDKKVSSADSVNFVFIKNVGEVKVVETSFKEVTEEAIRQGWVN